MTRWEKWSLHLLTLGVSTSGLVYFWMKYFLQSDDPFSLLNHPWQAQTLDLHLLLSPALVFVLGMITRSHVSRKLEKNTPPARRSGLLTLITFPIMVLSGYLPQIVSRRALLDGLLWIHLGSGILFSGTYLVHFVAGHLPSARTRKLAGRRSRARAERLLECSFLFLSSPGVAELQPGREPQASRVDAGRIRVERQVYLMGTRARLLGFFPSREAGLSQLEGLISALEASEAQLSTWRSDSLLSRLNRLPPGAPFDLDPETCRLFQILEKWTFSTGSSFDPALGRLIEAWDLHGSGRIPSPEELGEALRNSGLETFGFDRTRCSVRKNRNVLLDAGGFGKGEGLDRALQWSREEGKSSWLIDLGGQIAVRGHPAGESAWKVGIAHPLERRGRVLELNLKRGSLATSGGSERDLMHGGRRLPHILDPHTGRGAAFSGSVLVWHESALLADILSTALFVMGPEEGLPWSEEHSIAVCYLIPIEDAPSSPPRLLPSSRFRRMFLSGRSTSISGSRLPPNHPVEDSSCRSCSVRCRSEKARHRSSGSALP